MVRIYINSSVRDSNKGPVRDQQARPSCHHGWKLGRQVTAGTSSGSKACPSKREQPGPPRSWERIPALEHGFRMGEELDNVKVLGRCRRGVTGMSHKPRPENGVELPSWGLNNGAARMVGRGTGMTGQVVGGERGRLVEWYWVSSRGTQPLRNWCREVVDHANEFKTTEDLLAKSSEHCSMQRGGRRRRSRLVLSDGLHVCVHARWPACQPVAHVEFPSSSIDVRVSVLEWSEGCGSRNLLCHRTVVVLRLIDLGVQTKMGSTPREMNSEYCPVAGLITGIIEGPERG